MEQAIVVPFVFLTIVVVSCLATITLWKWMGHRQREPRSAGDHEQRLQQLEAEVTKLRDQVADAVIAADEGQWQRLDDAGAPRLPADA